MSKYPAVTHKEVIKVAQALGFELRSHQGTSHMQYKHQLSQRRLTISVHSKKNLEPDLMSWTFRQMGITKKKFFEVLASL